MHLLFCLINSNVRHLIESKGKPKTNMIFLLKMQGFKCHYEFLEKKLC